MTGRAVPVTSQTGPGPWLPPPRAAQRAAAPRSTGYLAGLDGLRAVAVVAVLLYHADLAWIPGGFLGVDVFFVISGFLITRLLLAEHERSGTVGVVAFWTRRARRLLPALYALLGVVCVVAALGYREEMARLRGQVLAALFYASNWYLIAVDQSYFADIERPMALQHLWSLAVEEQFYLVWPLVLVGLLRLLRGRLGALATVLAVGAVASAAWMAVLFEPAADPSRAYYGTDARLSGLLLGAAAAVLLNPARDPTRRGSSRVWLADVVGVAALGALTLALLSADALDSSLYRGGFFLVAVVATALVVASSYPGSHVGRALGHPALVWVGLRSYGLYLWHWPIYVVTRPGIDLPLGTAPTLVLRLGLTFLAADLSYRFVEGPVRDGRLSQWVAGLREPHAPGAATRRRVAAAVGAVGLVGVTAIGTGFANAREPAGPPPVQAAAVRVVALPPTTASSTPTTAANSAVASATTGAAASTVPASTVPASTVPASTVPTTPPTTTIPLEKRRVTVLCDSVLLGAQQAVTAELGAAGWAVDYRGRPALMIKESIADLQAAGIPVAPYVVVGLGYNSLWEKDRADHDRWAAVFDGEVERMLATLTALGAEKVVWVTLREPSPEVVPPKGQTQYRKYAWYFPYVNERLRALDQVHPQMVLADWAAVSNQPGITYDAIHLNDAGIRLMIDVIRGAGGF